MAIVDWNGTASSEIGTLYDWNGSTNSQIKEVYDWDGNVNSLIYSSQYVVFDNGNTTDYIGGWTLRASGSGNAYVNNVIYVYANNTANSYRAYFSNGKIPISQYSTITIDWQRASPGQWSTWGWNRIGLSSTQNVSWSQGYPVANINYLLREGGNGQLRETFSYDISNINTDYYLEIISNSGVDTYAGYLGWQYVYSIVLS